MSLALALSAPLERAGPLRPVEGSPSPSELEPAQLKNPVISISLCLFVLFSLLFIYLFTPQFYFP